MKKQKLQMAILAGAMSMAVQSQAAMYDITFTGGGWSASGQIDVVGGVADSGYLDVTQGSTTIDYGYLATGTGNIENNNGDVYPIGDNVISLTSSDFVDQYGLTFAQTPINGSGHSPAIVNLSADQNNGYVPNLNGYGNAPAGFGYNNPDVDGTASLVAIPEAASMAQFAGFSALGLFGFVSLRRKFPSK
jgi:hypothetical protein